MSENRENALRIAIQARDLIHEIETLDTENSLGVDVDAFISAHSGLAALESAIRDVPWDIDRNAKVCHFERNANRYQGRVFSLVGGGYGACVILPNGARCHADLTFTSDSEAMVWVERELERRGVTL